MMKKMAIPAGFRFRPTEEELINDYLRPKIMGQILPCCIVEEKQLYGGDPWDVLHDGNQWIVSETTDKGLPIKKTIYVFTRLTKKAAAGKLRKTGGVGGKEQFVRAAGCGTWDGQTGPREIKNRYGEVIGFRKMLVFEIRDLYTNSATHATEHYIMHEFSLPGGESDYVLCEIILDLKKRLKSLKRKRDVVEEAEEIVINSKRLMTTDDENAIICYADVPVVHDDCGPSSSSMESQVPLSVEYPNASYTDHELMPMMESQEQTLPESEWELDDLIKLDELLDSDLEAGPSCMESQVPLGVEYPNTSTSTDDLMPMMESQEQTLEWDDFINLEELLNSDHEVGPPCMEPQPLLVEYPNTSTDEFKPMMEFQQQTWEWDDNYWARSSMNRFDLMNEFKFGGMQLLNDIL